MATSGSVNYQDTRDVLIKDALLDIGAIAYEDSIPAGLGASAVRNLNRIIKRFHTYGMPLWKMRQVTVLLEKGKVKYKLGPTGDHAALATDITETAMRVAGVATDTVIECDDTTGMTAGDYVGVVLDDGSIHFTTVASVTDGDTFVLTAQLPSAAAIDNAIYFYTNKVTRPVLIDKAFIRDSSNNDRPVRILSRQAYYHLGNKSSSNSDIVEIYYDPQLTDGELYAYNPPSDVTDSLELIAQLPIEDMDAASDNFDFPQEWLLPLQKYLAWTLAPSQGLSQSEIQVLQSQAIFELEEALGWDTENTSIFLQPAPRGNT